jgi:tetratricopeptide (TPR) repeat protein
MSYAGNPSLSSDIQKRVLGTFEQTLGLAAEGNRQEALLGCDFVLRMDSQFEPARRLQERLRDSSGPVRVDDLLAPAVDDPFAGAINLDLPDVPAFGAPAAAGPGDLRGHFHALLEARRFQELLTLAHQQQEAVGRDPELMRMATAAQERMEAEPYVNKFLNAAQQAASQGQRDEVARLAEKIRALDPSHPGLAALFGAPAPAVPAATAFAPPAADAASAADMGFEMSFDQPAGSLDFGTSLPDLSFDTPSLDLSLDETPSIGMDPELVSAADFPSSLDLGGGIGGSGGSGGSGDSETDRRIRELLDEGQRAHDGGDLQGAIDAWSRIFLIDIDHQEAARRIEQARKLKAEHERQAEEIFHEGVAKIEAGDLQGARQDLQRVLEIQPGYFAAREYLQQLEAGKVPVIKPKPKETPSSSALPTPSDLDLDPGTGELKEEILIPPDPSEVAAAERQRTKQKPKPIGAPPARQGRARKTFVMVGSAVLVLALAGGAFVYLKKDQLFPNSQTDEASIGGPALADPIGRATEMQKSGKTQSAISQLKRIPPSDPAYAQAQDLIKQWSASIPATTPTPTATPAVAATPTVSPEQLAILTAARNAYQGGNYLEAIRRLEQASAQGQLEPSDAEMLANAKRQTEPLAAQIDLFRQHEWEHALRDLWRVHESDPGNRDVTRLMVDSYYNLGLRDLQRMDSAKAIENFTEAIGLDPGDKGLQRQLSFAQTYQERPKDLLYRIYVKHLPIR